MIKNRWFVVVLLVCIALAAVGAGLKHAQEQQQRRPDMPPPRPEFPKPDTVQIQQMFDKLSKAIEEKKDSPAVSVFQNVQVWKELPAGRFLGMMRAWTRTLGVDCAHCHVLDQWAKDDKAPKLTARAMDKFMDDVNGQIKNIKSISDERAHVTCWTCHRGQPWPETNQFRGGFPGGPRRGN